MKSSVMKSARERGHLARRGLRILLFFGLTNLWAWPEKTETVSYRSGDATVTGYLALPDSAGPHPAIVVIHEWWSMMDRGVYLPCSQFEAAFNSVVHGDREIEQTISAAKEALTEVA